MPVLSFDCQQYLRGFAQGPGFRVCVNHLFGLNNDGRSTFAAPQSVAV